MLPGRGPCAAPGRPGPEPRRPLILPARAGAPLVNPRNWVAEGIATYALVFFGPLSVVLSVVSFGDGLSTEAILMIALGHGAAIGIMVYAFGHISGAHINPAVTIPMVLLKKMSPAEGAGYVGFQIIGAVLASLTLLALLPGDGMAVGLGAHTGPSDLLGGSAVSGFVAEAIFTFFLVVTIFGVAVHKKAPAGIAGVAIGGMVFLLHVVGVPLTGASMNPARSFAPALVSGTWDFQWMYWAAPIAGGIVAAAVMSYLYTSRAEKEAEG